MVDQARQLYRAGVLERMVTAVPRSRVGLPRDMVSTRLRMSALRRVMGRSLPSTDPCLGRAVIRDFDRWATSQLGSPSAISSLSGFATSTLSGASERGLTVFCDRGSWHILEQKRILDEEAARIGAPPERFDPFIVDRELDEYEIADKIIVPSEAARRSFLRRGIDASRVVKVPYGVDISQFSTPIEDRHPGAIVSVATIGLQKGHHHLLQAFQMLQTRNSTLTLVGPISAGYDRYLNLNQPTVRMTGPVSRSRVIRELQQASIFVLASIHDGFGMVIAQAMACGLPVISTDAAGASELITDGVDGIIVPSPVSAENLAQAMEFLLSDNARSRAMGAAARRKVEAIGGWERYGRQLVSVFREGQSQSK
jgi:glycosyltransferase involved in cell wall biosynthesis